MSNVQARLIASSLALVAGAILYAGRPDDPFWGKTVLMAAGILFVVEYVRTQVPPSDVRPAAH